MDRRQLAYALLASLAAVVVGVAYAHVTGFYPATVIVNATTPPVIFEYGSNANQADLNANTIQVTIAENQTNLQITIHPSYQTTYYENITLIKNVDPSTTYNITLDVVTPLNLPAGSIAKIYVYNASATRDLEGAPIPAPASGSYVAEVDLTQAGKVFIGQLAPGQDYELDIEIYIPGGEPLPPVTQASLLLEITPA